MWVKGAEMRSDKREKNIFKKGGGVRLFMPTSSHKIAPKKIQFNECNIHAFSQIYLLFLQDGTVLATPPTPVVQGNMCAQGRCQRSFGLIVFHVRCVC